MRKHRRQHRRNAKVSVGARLGQHFLRRGWAARALIESVRPEAGEVILEIGPGKGALTRELLAYGDVVAIEKDGALVQHLRESFPAEISTGKLRLVHADVRDVTPKSLGIEGGYVLAANIPYYITGEIVRHFLTAPEQPRAMALLVQKEVAMRIVAGDGKQSILSLSVKAYGEPHIVAKVSRKDFSPPPRVDSAILVVEHVSRDFFRDLDEATFFEVVRAGFSSKRKKLLGNLKKIGCTKAIFHICTIAENARAEDVPLEKWKCLAKESARTR